MALRYQSLLWYLVLSVVIVLTAVLAAFIGLGLLQLGTLPDFGPLQSAVWSLLSFSAALGALTMVIVQVTRQLVPMRGRFQKNRLRLLLEFTGELLLMEDAVLAALRRLDQKSEGLKLITLDLGDALDAIGGRRSGDDGFDMPLEQLCGRLSAVAERVVADPRADPFLVAYLAGESGIAHLLTLFEPQLSTQSPDPNSNSPANGTAGGAENQPQKEEAFPTLDSHELRRLAAQQSLNMIIQERIDRFQIETGLLWRRYLRTKVLEVTLSFGLLFAVASAARSRSLLGGMGFVLYGTLGSIMAAFFAMLFRDLAALAERRRS